MTKFGLSGWFYYNIGLVEQLLHLTFFDSFNPYFVKMDPIFVKI